MWTSVCVVGGDGFIGSRLLKRHSNWESIDLKSGQDFCDMNVKIDANVIVLLAADLSQTMRGYANNLKIYNALVKRFMNKPVHIIFTSSAAVYAPSFMPQSEYMLPNPATIYGRSKLRGEHIIADMMSNYTILRLSNVYGDGDGHGVIDVFQQGGTKIFGAGWQVRDYIYVEKVCEAVSKVVDNPNSFNHMTINLSSGRSQTVNEVFKTFGMGEPTYLDDREFDVPFSVLNNDVAKGLGLL